MSIGDRQTERLARAGGRAVSVTEVDRQFRQSAGELIALALSFLPSITGTDAAQLNFRAFALLRPLSFFSRVSCNHWGDCEAATIFVRRSHTID